MKMNNSSLRRPAVSLIMPAYNAVEFIGEAIESVMSQTFEDWELIIVDDGSSDATADVIAQYAAIDKRIRLMNMPAPSGSAYQPRKLAILNAKASIVSPLDADDRLDSRSLEILMQRRKETGANIVYPTMYIQSDTEIKRYVPTEKKIMTEVFCGKDAVVFTLDGWRIGCNGGVIDKELYCKVFRDYNSTVTGSFADELLSRQLLYEATRVAFSESRYYYRQNFDSITHRKSLKIFENIPMNRQLYEFIKNRYGIASDEYRLMQRQLFHGIFGSLRSLNRYGFCHADRKMVYEELQQNLALLDWKYLSEVESAIYYRFLRLFGKKLSIARVLLGVGDKIHPVK